MEWYSLSPSFGTLRPPAFDMRKLLNFETPLQRYNHHHLKSIDKDGGENCWRICSNQLRKGIYGEEFLSPLNSFSKRWLKLRPLAPQMLPGFSMQFPKNLSNGDSRNRMFIRSWDKNCLQVKVCTLWSLLLEALMSTFHPCRISFKNFLNPGGGVKMKKCSVSATSPCSDL